MQLMLKPTLACQFKCDFCSAACYRQKNITSVTDQLRDGIKRLDPENIIITGGDPLMMDQRFFLDLLAINDRITLSLTTNLWGFFKDPDRWTDLFRDERVMVTTSFQYGDRRKKPDGTPYAEEDFVAVERLFDEKIGYVPEFISVICRENESRAIDHVLLAKKLGTKCKLNGMLPVGLSKEYYPRYRLLDIQFRLIDMGLDEYETNTFERASGKCPNNVNLDCYKYNRTMILEESGNYRFSYCEDLAFTGPYFHDIGRINEKDELLLSECIEKEKCHQCRLFRFCNACRVQRLAAKTDACYCRNMSKYISKLEKYGYCI